MSDLNFFKKQFHTSGKIIHMNNAGITPLPAPARQVVETWVRRHSEDGAAFIPEIRGAMQATRDHLASLLGTKPELVAFFPNTSGALSQVALGFPLQAGDEVIVWDQEYPSNFYPWKEACERAGARLVIAQSVGDQETPAEAMLRLITPKTKIIAFSWVQYRAGAITNIGAITSVARAKGIFTCADIIQGAGALPFNFLESGLDAACGGSHKWLTGLSSTGYLLLRVEHIKKLRPTSVGAMSFGTWDDLSNPDAVLHDSIHRYEPGAVGLLDVLGFGASLKLHKDVGVTVIAEEIRRLSLKLSEGLSAVGYEMHSRPGSHILNFTPTAKSPAKDIAAIDERLKRANVTYAKRPPGVRLSPHAFNTDANIDAALKALS